MQQLLGFDRGRIVHVGALCIWIIVVLIFLLWNFKTFSLLDTTTVYDPEAARNRIENLRYDLLLIFLPLFLSICAVWIISFWKKLITPFLIISPVGVVIGIFLIALGLGSACEGLACFGAGFLYLFGLLVLGFVAISTPFIFFLRSSESPMPARIVSAGLFIILSLAGIILFETSSKNLQRVSEQRLADKIAESRTLLFDPEYLPRGAKKSTEDNNRKRFFSNKDEIHPSARYQFELYQSYSIPLPEGFNQNLDPGYVEIEQFKALRSFEQYYKEYFKRWSYATWMEDEILVNGLKTRAIVSGSSGSTNVFLVRNGTAIEIAVNCSVSCTDAHREAIAIAESLRPKNKSFDFQPPF